MSRVNDSIGAKSTRRVHPKFSRFLREIAHPSSGPLEFPLRDEFCLAYRWQTV
ncbi:hypothetical protein ACNKHT_23500 [Shigella flexneri]